MARSPEDLCVLLKMWPVDQDEETARIRTMSSRLMAGHFLPITYKGSGTGMCTCIVEVPQEAYSSVSILLRPNEQYPSHAEETSICNFMPVRHGCVMSHNVQ